MVTDQQVKRLRMLVSTEETKAIAAAKAGMDRKTARKYVKNGKLPSELKKEHNWRTRQDPFKDTWPKIAQMMKINPGLEAKTVFQALQRKYPGKWPDGQLRTLQRRIKIWRATKGSAKEVYFPQKHYPGQLSSSDFTGMNKLNITIQRQRFEHILYHFTLTYSNWEAGTVCFSESYESLSEGIQRAFWKSGGVTSKHRTDCLSAAIHKDCNREKFTERYKGLLAHYGVKGESTQPASPHENGDIEQRHNRLKKAIGQALMLRGSRDFNSKGEYEAFLAKVLDQLNAGRKGKFIEECKTLRPLPASKLDACKSFLVKVGPSSTIRVLHNVYSVHSRLIGEWIKARAYVDHIEIWYAQRKIDGFPRIRGASKHRINYRHIINWLIRKPGAFKNYRYRDDLFPSSHFRMAYDYLKEHIPYRADKEYLKILHLAAAETEAGVESAIRELFAQEGIITAAAILEIIETPQKDSSTPKVIVEDVSLKDYDGLLNVLSRAEAINE